MSTATTGQTEQGDLVSQFSTMCEAFQATAAVEPDAVALRGADGSLEITWREYSERVRSLAAGLAARGVGRGDTVALMLTNRPEFHLVDTAAVHLGATPFSIYNTSAPDQIAHLFENSGCRVVVAEAQFLDRIEAARGDRSEPSVLVSVDALEELEAAGADDFDFEAAWRAVQPDDVLTLIYTSGTTGPPKGVETTHANMLAQCKAASAVLPVQRGDRITSYLPSAHIADRWSSHYNQMVFGIQITSVPDPRAVAAVLPQVKPTIWGAVPRVLEKIKAALEAGIGADPDEARREGLRKAIDLGIQKARLEQAGEGVPAEMAAAYRQADEMALSKLRAKLGLDETRWIVAGAAAVPRDVYEFLLALGLPVTEIYGMSECSCVVSAAPPEKAKIGSVGPALPGVEVTLAEDGEMLVRGDTVMKGYRNEPEQTAEAIDSDGWMHTGDIATIDEDGFIRIVDRKKELIINAAGKNMSPANIENELKGAHPLIGQAAVIGDGRPYNVALIVLDPDAAAGVDRAQAEAAVAEGVARANERLSRVEQIKRYELLDEEWLPGGDELTPTMKLKRKPISEKYAQVIETLYSG